MTNKNKRSLLVMNFFVLCEHTANWVEIIRTKHLDVSNKDIADSQITFYFLLQVLRHTGTLKKTKEKNTLTTQFVTIMTISSNFYSKFIQLCFQISVTEIVSIFKTRRSRAALIYLEHNIAAVYMVSHKVFSELNSCHCAPLPTS